MFRRNHAVTYPYTHRSSLLVERWAQLFPKQKVTGANFLIGRPAHGNLEAIHASRARGMICSRSVSSVGMSYPCRDNKPS